jgi:pyridoxal phosphate enzyme (YggS family)
MLGALLVVADRLDEPQAGDRRVAAVRGQAVRLRSRTVGDGEHLEAVQARFAAVRQRIEARGVDPGGLRIVAVTKGFGPDAVASAVRAGLVDVGENYAQELVVKAAASPGGARWHFLGNVQRNKVRRLAPLVSTWHCIDRPAAAEAVAAVRPGVEVLVEVNVSGARSRPGCRPDDVEDLVAHCRGLPLGMRGLMVVAPAGDSERARDCFRWLSVTARRLGLRELSMGMSDDFEVAVEEGATILRLGRVLFGPRPGRSPVQR